MSDPFRRSFETVERERGKNDLRTRAMARFTELGLPTQRDEEWRFTSVAPIAKQAYPLARPGADGVTKEDVLRLQTGGDTDARVVFVDGHYREDLSATGKVDVRSLADVLGNEPALVARFLDRAEERAFAALNGALLEDGAVLFLPKAACHVRPIEMLYVATGGKSCYPRNLVVAGEGSHATIVETWVSLGGEGHFTDVVTDVEIGPNASVDHCRLQLENEEALHVSTTRVRQGRDSHYTSHTVTLGGKLVRNDIDASLDAENINCTLNGLFLTRGTRHVDNHTLLEHRKPRCESHELYKGILDDRSTGVFSGKIHVFEDAQKTDAKQSSASLLLSEHAVVDAKPQLEIYADDVKCTHGATIGQLDPDALFYLRSRGLPAAEARNMLIGAFAADITHRIRVPAARERVDALLGTLLGSFSAEVPVGAG